MLISSPNKPRLLLRGRTTALALPFRTAGRDCDEWTARRLFPRRAEWRQRKGPPDAPAAPIFHAERRAYCSSSALSAGSEAAGASSATTSASASASTSTSV